MKVYEALSMLCAARDGIIPSKKKAVSDYGKRSKQILREMGMSEEELNGEYPQDKLDNGLFLMSNHPMVFAQQARASAAWLIQRN